MNNTGYEILRGKSLQALKLFLANQDASDMNVGSKGTQSGLFNFRAFINTEMLLTESGI